ncbi:MULTISPECIES: phytanoyl-CoA dioxygenase family protein [unclassified Novosphingobium]|uniref:phytanoyl-CoA dioxygenase family protein n=1 Tax=unclassified Novosphingobium TaxID=2644732 RepID=UPI000D47F715|nr:MULTISPECIES: phytanoyl-CoA dioxygenase family protein [unclassified Novosphingobium]PTR10396.1 phytanoyl-CoA dioxygenase PhyH [Novosphingobium sp. GV055]PUB03067.1 phytanoyl-CoA dioxygenase PhyH [Novosphingobium sp. GV061]PUB19728.1 phytanoyl-CoA dioxygenase PhyH [Novosphingobium sp. GV079]PUB41367.1 phytanoyl-CoA dioxygenase PhyH [Novosphingobium sp. GV027]
MHNPLPGIPLVESPLFPQLKATMALTDTEMAIADSLATRGFAVFDFPDAALDARIDRIKANLGPRFGIAFEDAQSDKTGGERRVQDAWQFDADVRAIATNQAVLDLLTKLYGRQAFPFQTLNFPVGTQQDAHTDMVHFSSLPERFMCGVWLAMEDIGPDAGPLFYLPGSHRWPALNNGMIGRRGFGSKLSSAQDPFAEAWRALVEANGAAPETFLARKGQALIWTANLLHGGSVQNDPRLTRWSQVTHYYFDDCIYYTPAFSDEFLGRLDVRRPYAITEGAMRQGSYLGVPLPRPAKRGWRGVLRRLRGRK